MEGRGLLRRERSATGRSVFIVIQAAGSEALAIARPVHAAAVRKHVLSHLGTEEAKVILRLALTV
jgi:DNA-binding MarR family transcriptional regulator